MGVAFNWRLCNRLKAKPRLSENRASCFRIEQLEPRLLLSADLVPQPDTVPSSQDPNNSAIVLLQDSVTGGECRVASVEWDQPETATSDEWRVTNGESLAPLVAEAVDQLSKLGFSAEELQRAGEA
jgi:hypothetical protein